MTVLFKLDHPDAKAPTRATDGSAGFDFYALERMEVWPGARCKIPTGVKTAIPEGYAGFMWPRSGLAVKHGLDLLAGLIDSDYRDQVHVAAINHGDRMIEIKKGERIAQMVVGPYVAFARMVEDLPDPGTRAGGFGSTGA